MKIRPFLFEWDFKVSEYLRVFFEQSVVIDVKSAITIVIDLKLFKILLIIYFYHDMQSIWRTKSSMFDSSLKVIIMFWY